MSGIGLVFQPFCVSVSLLIIVVPLQGGAGGLTEMMKAQGLGYSAGELLFWEGGGRKDSKKGSGLWCRRLDPPGQCPDSISQGLASWKGKDGDCSLPSGTRGF